MRVFKNIGQIITLSPASQKKGRGLGLEDLGLISDGILVERDGQILWVGSEKEMSQAKVQELTQGSSHEEIDLEGRTIMPSFVECHTHSVFAGNRQNEFELRNQGVSYTEIAKQGGGILSTVEATRNAGFEELICLAQTRVDRFFNQGVTCLEIKSGYGLSHEAEIKMLEVIQHLKGPEIVATYLGPHAVPPEMSLQNYLDEILNTTLPEVAKRKLAERADIFIEEGFYTCEQAQSYYEKAQNLGFQLTGHVEQISNKKGCELGLQMNALSLDHLVQVNQDQIKKLATSQSTCVLLPGADFYLQMDYPPARDLIDQGARVAIASDFNPGSCPTQDLSFIGGLARLEMKMTLPEVIVAYTLNAAAALGRERERGSLDQGKSCDFIVLEDDHRDLFYQVGEHPVRDVFVKGNSILH